MSALLGTDNAGCIAAEHFLVTHGKSGSVGNFRAAAPVCLRRGDRVVIDSARGREIGTILCAASVLHGRVLQGTSHGLLVRPLTPSDDAALDHLRALEQRLFEAARRLAQANELPIEIIDVDVFFEERALVQFLGPHETPLDGFAGALGEDFSLDIRLENLGLEKNADEQGCGKPDCGKTAGGGCTTCATGGGCSSCGAGPPDLRPYFAHLRDQMDAKKRTSLA